MLETCKGIVLKKIQYADTKYLLKILTSQEGLSTFSANASMSRKSLTRSVLGQPMALVEFSFFGKPSSEIRTIKSIHIDEPFLKIPHDIIRQSIVLFMNEMVLQTIRLPLNDKSMYDFLKASLKLLDNPDLQNKANFPVWFSLQLALKLGIGPRKPVYEHEKIFDLVSGKFMNQGHLPGITLSEETSQKFLQFLNTDFPPAIDMSKRERMTMLQFIIDYFAFHADFDAHIKSADVLSMVFRS